MKKGKANKEMMGIDRCLLRAWVRLRRHLRIEQVIIIFLFFCCPCGMLLWGFISVIHISLYHISACIARQPCSAKSYLCIQVITPHHLHQPIHFCRGQSWYRNLFFVRMKGAHLDCFERVTSFEGHLHSHCIWVYIQFYLNYVYSMARDDRWPVKKWKCGAVWITCGRLIWMLTRRSLLGLVSGLSWNLNSSIHFLSFLLTGGRN